MTDTQESWYKQFADARSAFRSGDWDAGGRALTEASLSRVLHHVQNAGTTGLSIVTAWKSDVPKVVNQTNMEKLRQELQSRSLGFNQLRGHWRDPASGQESSEPSYAVHNLPLEHALALGRKYKQDAILHSGPETKGRMHLIDLTSGEHADKGAFHVNKTSPEGWSELHNRLGRTFVFEYVLGSVGESQLVALHEQNRRL